MLGSDFPISLTLVLACMLLRKDREYPAKSCINARPDPLSLQDSGEDGESLIPVDQWMTVTAFSHLTSQSHVNLGKPGAGRVMALE